MGGKLSAGELEDYLHRRIPLSKLMRIKVEVCEPGRLVLTAPLEVNHNHLGTAFGGSLATVATLAGYGALWAALGDRDAHVVVKRSEIDYLRPVRGEIRATCLLGREGIDDGFRRAFEARGRARRTLEVKIRDGDEECVSFVGEFVVLR